MCYYLQKIGKKILIIGLFLNTFVCYKTGRVSAWIFWDSWIVCSLEPVKMQWTICKFTS